MKKTILAQQMRERQYNLGLVEKAIIDLLDDNQIIQTYNKCSCCDEQILSDKELKAAISLADDLGHFLHISEQMSDPAYANSYKEI